MLLKNSSKEENGKNHNKLIFNQECRFLYGVDRINFLPDNKEVTEIIFFGRSNSGKSTIINSIVNRSNLCRVSKTPGRTKQINFFIIDSMKLVFVDLPGYGFAKTSKNELKRIDKLIRNFLINRKEKEAKKLYLIIDSRRLITNLDKLIIEFINYLRIDMQIILSKIDKVSNSSIGSRVLDIQNDLKSLKIVDQKPVLLFSALTKQGLENVRNSIISSLYHLTIT